MLEQLLGSGGFVAKYLPNSGPGNKTLLAGDEQLGFFGEVASAQLIDSGELELWLGISGGTVVTATGLVWLKFIRKGKVIYYAKTHVRSALPWNTLYLAGAVYGERGPGYNSGANPPTDQLKTKVIQEGDREWMVKARLPRGYNTDPFVGPGTSHPEAVIGSEWEDLMNRVVSGGHLYHDLWAKYTLTGLTLNGPWTLVAETMEADVLKVGMRGGGSITASGSSTRTNTSTGLAWRPVLELVNQADYVFDADQMTGELQSPLIEPQGITATFDLVVSPEEVAYGMELQTTTMTFTTV